MAAFNKISIVIPTYNESGTIEELLRRVEAADLGMEKEIIVVDNNSTDGTQEILRRCASHHTLIFQERNMGMSNSIRKGLQAATGDLLMKQDADLEYDPNDIKLLLAPILEGKAEAAIGSRFLRGTSHAAWNFKHLVGNKLLTYVSNIITNMFLTDMECCYKLYTRRVYERLDLRSQRFEFEPEITVEFAKRNVKVWEVAISYSPRNYSEGKKVKWIDGFHAMWTMIKVAYFRK